MSRTTSPGTGRVYGVERVCAIWDVPRSSFYAEQQRKVAEPTRPTARRRGPKPKISDEDLLAAILADLEALFAMIILLVIYFWLSNRQIGRTSEYNMM